MYFLMCVILAFNTALVCLGIHDANDWTGKSQLTDLFVAVIQGSTLVAAAKEIGLEVNADKTKYNGGV